MNLFQKRKIRYNLFKRITTFSNVMVVEPRGNNTGFTYFNKYLISAGLSNVELIIGKTSTPGLCFPSYYITVPSGGKPDELSESVKQLKWSENEKLAKKLFRFYNNKIKT